MNNALHLCKNTIFDICFLDTPCILLLPLYVLLVDLYVLNFVSARVKSIKLISFVF